MTSKNYQMTVDAQPQYIAEQSSIAKDCYVFAYHIRITNSGTESAQLISRHWLITDANEQQQEVRGMGVVGEQPHLAPGESFEYTSGTQLNTPYGTMQGSYQFVAEDGTRFEVAIPTMQLLAPRTLH